MRMPLELEESLKKQAAERIDSINPELYIKTQTYIRNLIQTCTCSGGEECESQAGIEISDIFIAHGEEYRRNHKLTPEQSKAMYAIENCRTESYGYHVEVCDKCGHIERGYNSCRNRHCPKCQGIAKDKWVQSRIDEILPVSYHHATFTVPGEISYLSQYNKKMLYDLLFKASSQTLLTFGHDPKWLGAEIGFYGVLHTWSQSIWTHIHIHYIITAGGITEQGEWKEPKYKKKFLFPVKAMAKTFRKNMLEGLQELYDKGSLVIPYNKPELNDPKKFELWLSSFNRTPWIIDSRPPFSGPEAVIKYIGRYTHRTAISSSRIVSFENGEVCFKYKDNKQKDKSGKAEWKEMTLTAEEFIERFLMHVLPERYHRIRNFGFLTNSKKHGNIKKIRGIFQAENMLTDTGRPDNEENAGYICPACKQGKMKTFLVVNSAHQILKFDIEAFIPLEFTDTS